MSKFIVYPAVSDKQLGFYLIPPAAPLQSVPVCARTKIILMSLPPCFRRYVHENDPAAAAFAANKNGALINQRVCLYASPSWGNHRKDPDLRAQLPDNRNA